MNYFIKLIFATIFSVFIFPAFISIVVWFPILNIFTGGEITSDLIFNSVVLLNGLNLLIHYLGLRRD